MGAEQSTAAESVVLSLDQVDQVQGPNHRQLIGKQDHDADSNPSHSQLDDVENETKWKNNPELVTQVAQDQAEVAKKVQADTIKVAELALRLAQKRGLPQAVADLFVVESESEKSFRLKAVDDDNDDFLTPSLADERGGEREEKKLERGYWGQESGNKPHGYGVMVNRRGSVYAGHLEQGAPHGRGRVVLPGGGHYAGDWASGQPAGSGVCTWPDGDSAAGQWAAGKLHGWAVCASQDGREYSGKYWRGQKHGPGRELAEGGESRGGTWHRGWKAGVFLIEDHEGRVSKKTFVSGDRLPKVMRTPGNPPPKHQRGRSVDVVVRPSMELNTPVQLLVQQWESRASPRSSPTVLVDDESEVDGQCVLCSMDGWNSLKDVISRSPRLNKLPPWKMKQSNGNKNKNSRAYKEEQHQVERPDKSNFPVF